MITWFYSGNSWRYINSQHHCHIIMLKYNILWLHMILNIFFKTKLELFWGHFHFETAYIQKQKKT